jgi:chemotaxis protein CheY-P-specific phosphatase CheC
MPELCDCAVLPHLVETLEQMAFVTVMPAEATPSAPAGAMLVTIRFSGGPVRGRVRLLAGRELGEMVAGNITGPDAATEASGITPADALRELVNVTTGSLLAAWEGVPTGMVFEMSLPEAKDMTPAEWQNMLEEPGFTVLEAEGHPLAIGLSMEH